MNLNDAKKIHALMTEAEQLGKALNNLEANLDNYKSRTEQIANRIPELIGELEALGVERRAAEIIVDSDDNEATT